MHPIRTSEHELLSRHAEACNARQLIFAQGMNWGWGSLIALGGVLAGCSNDASDAKRSLGLPPAREPFVSLARALAPVCEPGYAGDPEARPFDPNQPAPHRMLFVAQDGTAHPLNNVIPEAWWPSSVAQVELVVCTEDVQSSNVETCEYSDGTRVNRVRQQLALHVVSVQSGAREVVTEIGSDPMSCPLAIEHAIPDIMGSLPSPDQIRDGVVERMIPAPTCQGARPFASCLQCWPAGEAVPPGGCGTVLPGEPESRGLRSGQSTILSVDLSSDPVDALFLPYVGVDWSGSENADLLDALAGQSVTFQARTPGVYNFLARLSLPATATGQVLGQRSFTVEVSDFPTIAFDFGVGQPITRIGLKGSFGIRVSGREPTLHSRERASFTWVERPAGSRAAEPVVSDEQFLHWSFDPDVTGEYRAELVYDDGLGPSPPLISDAIVAIDRPLVALDAHTRSGMVARSMTLSALPSYLIGEPKFAWTLALKPVDSVLPDAIGVTTTQYLNLTPDVPGTYLVEVVLSDDAGTSEPSQVTISVE